MFGISFEKALPYLLGGAFVFLLLRKSKSSEVKVLEKNAVTDKVKYITMTDLEKSEFCKSKAKLFKSLLGGFPDRDSIVAFYKSYDFCLLRIAQEFNEYFWFGSMSYETRQLFLGLNSSKFIHIEKYVAELEANEL